MIGNSEKVRSNKKNPSIVCLRDFDRSVYNASEKREVQTIKNENLNYANCVSRLSVWYNIDNGLYGRGRNKRKAEPKPKLGQALPVCGCS